MSENSLLSIKNLNVYYGASHALQDINLQLGSKPLAIVGRNGMGKTTLCNAIIGLAPARSGQIIFDGRDISGMKPEERAKAGLGYVPQGRRVFRSLSVEEHLLMVEMKGRPWNRERVYETFPRLAERRRNFGNQLSGGEQQMLAISRALMLNPTLLIMDEPTEGLAPAIVDHVIDLLLNLTGQGTQLLLIEQNISVALAAASFVSIMTNGRIETTLASDQLADDTDLQQKFLGIDLRNKQVSAHE